MKVDFPHNHYMKYYELFDKTERYCRICRSGSKRRVSEHSYFEDLKPKRFFHKMIFVSLGNGSLRE